MYLCGRRAECKLNSQEEKMVKSSLDRLQKERMSFEQLNEILLLMNQNRIGEGFFNFFFGDTTITLQELKEGIIKFRCYAMLRYGNFRFGFKELLSRDELEIDDLLKPFSETSEYCDDQQKSLT